MSLSMYQADFFGSVTRLGGMFGQRQEPRSRAWRMKCSRRTARSDLKLDADLHNLRARDVEICARPLGVVMHEGE